ncbi:MAG TPA: peptidyl-prolyl cis-trans isomerase [Vicinamibacteria bacterium]|nr:peptidyl-prolyl cis-trans isomerase [Vicinamibacteria bacterium]
MLRPCIPAVLMLLAACQVRTASDPVILRLKEQEVRRSDFESYLRDMEKQQGGTIAPDVRSALLGAFLERRLLVLEARDRGLLKGQASPEQEQAAVRELLAQETREKTQVDEREVDEYFAAHRADFTVPETIVLRQILVTTSNEARDVRRRLLKDPKSFETLAQTVSHGPEAPSGGLMGEFARGQLPPDLEAAAFALSAGQTGDVVETSLGFHVLRLESRAPARDADLEECRPRIRTLLTARKQERSEREFIAGLLARAKVNHEAAQAHPADS